MSEDIAPAAAPEPVVATSDANANGNADVPARNGSLQAQLRAMAQRTQQRKTVDLAIPGYDGRLWGTFRALDDYSEHRKIVARHERLQTEQQELYIAADTLIAASVDTFAVLEDGQREPLNLRLGLALAGYLGLEGAETDRQAVFMLISSTMQIVELYVELEQFRKASTRETVDELVGESEAASSPK